MYIDCSEKIIRDIAKVVDFANAEVYLVGGFVRDKVLGKTPKDIDFVVVGDGIKFAEEVASFYKIKKVIKYKRFETAKVPFKGSEIEFVSAREELYEKNSRKPRVKKTTLKTDILRRDFTINTLAARVSLNTKSEVIDYLGGLEDLKKGVIRTPLDPFITYSEDPLRMLRAIRFSSKFGYKIEKESFDAIRENLSRLSIVSAERISDEFFKIVDSDRFVEGVELLDRSGLLNIIFPELSRLKGAETKLFNKDSFIHSLEVAKKISEISNKRELRISALFHKVENYDSKESNEDVAIKLINTIGYRMKWPRSNINYISKIVKLYKRVVDLSTNCITDYKVRKLLFEGGDFIEDLMVFCKAYISTLDDVNHKRYYENYNKLSKRLLELEEKHGLREFNLAIDGKDIMDTIGVYKGPIIGKVKKYITDKVVVGEIENSREVLLNTLKLIDNGTILI
ncbi:MAG: tRNA nucleotidyltransferase [Candidatus Cloacimonadota bacterium]|nr:MAG: tRNA nucleotidyltransferase [Candidatus Cloacimonadota bacterium]PIE77600.1 MAG: tRNA nucleotidyltransferase [Candidatus Delongbacteria bacterium]